MHVRLLGLGQLQDHGSYQASWMEHTTPCRLLKDVLILTCNCHCRSRVLYVVLCTGSIPAEQLPPHAGKLTDVAKTLNIVPLLNLTKNYQKQISAAERYEDTGSVQGRRTSAYLRQATMADDEKDNTYEKETESVRESDSTGNDIAHSGGGVENKEHEDVMMRVDEQAAATDVGCSEDSSVVSTGK